ncbi:MaoC family dehydratase [Brevundimonas sp. LPMIX5]|uniref:MaoC family dehydratase n=1 Tax=Brevundimonas sp. LPMIX5 TaxID=2305887 RepID=UPI000E66236F|nr:MaoC family dehydratase [Brevundimonas sp. LPMIX5]RIJ65090.1 MaoC family dehydratase [Brevundimonas sp. LPMIX5]
MSEPLIVAYADLPGLAGRDLGVSDWLSLDQARIARFADATEDHQWIHVDVERASREMGGPIAHGFLTLSLLPRLQDDLLRIEGADKVLNVGVNKVRFVSPAPSGARLRLRQTVAAVEARAGGWQIVSDCVIEGEGLVKPLCVVQSVMLALPAARSEAVAA